MTELPAAAGPSTIEKIRARGVFLWGYDSEGGAPHVFPYPKDPSYQERPVKIVKKKLEKSINSMYITKY